MFTALVGCTQDFNKFLPTGTGGNTGSTTGSMTTTTAMSSSSTGIMCSTNCDDMNACTTDTCDGMTGQCVHVNVADMTALPDTMMGDCKKNVCVAGMPALVNDDTDPPADTDPNDCKKPACMAGAVVMVNNDTEMPSNGNDCQTGTCNMGTPVYANKADNTACGAGGAFKCLGGKCGCNVASDCGTDTPCGTWACNAKVCNDALQPAGPAPTGQTAGDCQIVNCNGTSATPNTAYDPTDPNNGGNPCITYACTNNPSIMTTQTDKGAGVTCMGTKECDGAGTCCTPTGNACAGKTCGMVMDNCNATKTCGTCSGGTPDCLVNTCVFCTAASECSGSSNGHACITNSKCGCNAGGDCPVASPACKVANNTCVACIDNTTCSGGTSECKVSSNTCVQCVDNTPCTGGTPACNTTSNACVACFPLGAGSAQCAANGNGTACITGDICGCMANTDCSGAKPACDTGTSKCAACFPLGTGSAQCTANAAGGECLTGDVCGCTVANQATDCAGTTHAGNTCIAGACSCTVANQTTDCAAFTNKVCTAGVCN